MNIFKFELKANFKNTLIWTGSICLLMLFFMSVLPVFLSAAGETKTLFQGFPPQILQALSIDLDSFFSLTGFYSVIILYIMLGGAVQAMSLGITIISKEYRNKTADFLLSKPASRARILTGKLTAVLVSLLFTNAVFLTVAVVSALVFKSGEFDMGVFVMISLSMLFVQLIFAAMGFLTATVFHKIRSVLSVSLSAVFTFFIISLVQALLKEDFVNFLTPFKYFDSKYIIANHSYELRFVITAILVIAACIGTGYALYIKRDVHSV